MTITAPPAVARAGVLLLAGGLAVAGCAAPDDGGSASTSIVLADGYELGGYNPVAGHGEAGNSRIYDGLLRLASAGEAMPEFEPALAAEPPVADPSGQVWTVRLRDGVSFTDGTPFGADDVVATYEAILDPASASPLASSFEMLESVAAPSADTVEFRLKYPYAAWPTKMLLGIAPSERLAPGPAEASALNTEPVGTGPYRLTSLRADQAVFEANRDYWDGAPGVETLTVVHVPDDNARAQRVAAGEVDGANLPPLLADTFSGRGGLEVDANTSADWRGISLAPDGPVTSDPAVRTALNLAVDRDAMVDGILAGYGRAASTPIPDVYGDAYDPSAVFAHDPQRAQQILDDAGWRAGADGMRERDGIPARFTVMYFPEDTLRRDLAQAFASDAHEIGIRVDLDAADRSVLPQRLPRDAAMLGGGDLPYDPDTQAYATLHSSYNAPGVGGAYDNASGYVNPEVDAALDAGRRSLDPAERDAAYREVQRAYVTDPGYVMLVFLDHTYVRTASDWAGIEPILEPHSHGVDWGPWWNLREWRRP
ncbi:ABC transporter substrate-binding protein [Rhodococcus rhodnii]|uniref:Peptide ABC transporter substrate-binding protein n=1 Tax=Rhodococcus rhodnii LMG 5362 TaxID=1273125 RepID=R7WLS2_9NOCA|nr:ABC transporter substrate-binding protein [Rhodococcus rhodnii]EOM74954.1 peptide ABC transporter substrate-binding protein [Rhodococcus rhodnii LMG 5362]